MRALRARAPILTSLAARKALKNGRGLGHVRRQQLRDESRLELFFRMGAALTISLGAGTGMQFEDTRHRLGGADFKCRRATQAKTINNKAVRSHSQRFINSRNHIVKLRSSQSHSKARNTGDHQGLAGFATGADLRHTPRPSRNIYGLLITNRHYPNPNRSPNTSVCAASWQLASWQLASWRLMQVSSSLAQPSPPSPWLRCPSWSLPS